LHLSWPPSFLAALVAFVPFCNDSSCNACPGRAEEVGCADCHRPSVGNIAGIYSDLLLHKIGPDLISVTVQVYYSPTEKVDIPTAASLADGSEWRAPPLWGYRESGPYLHDGRTRDLVEAVKVHKGQARDSAARFFRLSQRRQSLIERYGEILRDEPGTDAARIAADRLKALGGEATD
jgi:CxxC motif-containing protein (DUF1111 family)